MTSEPTQPTWKNRLLKALKKNPGLLVIPLLWTIVFLIPDQKKPLTISGNITDRNTGTVMKHAEISVYDKDNSLVEQIQTDAAGNYTVDLSTMEEEKYLFRISATGYLEKLFVVSTANIPKEERGTSFPVITADLALFKPVPGIDYTLLKTPLARYYYDAEKDNYAYDKVLMQRTLAGLQELERLEKERTVN